MDDIRRTFSSLCRCYSRQKQDEVIANDSKKCFIYCGVEALNVTKAPLLIIGDFGSSYGSNSIYTMKTIIEYLEKARKLQGLPLIIHNDLPTNEWTKLFQLISNNKAYHGLASGCSFYEECLPEKSLSIAFSSAALHVLSKKPCNISNHCYVHFANEGERQIFKHQSQLDFHEFIKHRSRELRAGGVLILSIPSIDEDGEMGFNYYFDLIYRCAKSLAILTSQELMDFTIPFYLRSFSECVDFDLFNQYSLKLIKFEIVSLKSMIFDQYQHGKIGIDHLAKSLAALLKSGTELALRKSLQSNQRSSEEIERVIEDFWSTFEDKIKDEPQQDDVKTYATHLLLKKL